MTFWMRTIRKLISIARGTYNACQFWTHRTSGSVRKLTISWKYAYKTLMLHSGSPKHSVVMNAISSTCDRSLHMTIELWTHVTWIQCLWWMGGYPEPVTYVTKFLSNVPWWTSLCSAVGVQLWGRRESHPVNVRISCYIYTHRGSIQHPQGSGSSA